LLALATVSAPKTYARAAGLLYLVPLLCGPFSMMYVPSVIVVPNDAPTTASRLLASESLFRLGLVSDTAVFLSEVALTAVLYVLLRPAGRVLALTATLARLATAVIQAANLFPQLAALQILGGAAYLSAFDVSQRQAAALGALNLHALGVHVWELFFGLHCAIVGVLLFRSSFFPRALGVLMGIAALGYSLNAFGNLVMPGAAGVLAALVGVTALIGEIPFVVWLLFGRVDAERWRAPR
jgi:hypothetical protein